MILKDLCNLAAIPGLIFSRRYLIWQWTARLLKIRHTGSILGPLWTLATPLFMLVVYTFVFGIVFGARWQMLDPNLETTGSYAVILFCGLAVFQVFSETVSGSCRCILDNPNLVKKVIFPLEILPVAQMLSAAISSLLWFLLVIIAALLSSFPISATILLFPLVFFPLLALSLGVGWFAAATSVYLRDFPHLITILLQALFFLTPIFYPESLVPKNLTIFLDLNPLAWICRQCRDLLLFGIIPRPAQILLTWLFCAIIAQLGHVWFIKVRRGFADVL